MPKPRFRAGFFFSREDAVATKYFYTYQCSGCKHEWGYHRKMGFWDFFKDEKPNCPRCKSAKVKTTSSDEIPEGVPDRFF